jgi:uncharacterized protein (TIGR03083 family)
VSNSFAEHSRIDKAPGPSHDEWMEIGRAQNYSFLKLLRNLGSDDWSSSTDCEHWNVKDIAAHILGEAEGFTSFSEQGRQFIQGLKRRKEAGSLLDAMNNTQVEDRRRLSTDELVARLEERLPAFLDVRNRVGRAGKAVPIYEPHLGRCNLRYLMDTIFARDAFMHRVDIGRATGRDPELTEYDRLLIGDVVRDWARRRRADAVVDLTGPAGGSFVARSGSSSVRGDAIEFCRVLTGRAQPQSIDIEGDRSAVEQWLALGCPF